MSPAAPRKVFTFLSRTAPYGSNRPQLCLDMALAAAVFEQDIRYVFLGDGVYQLLAGQNAENISSKTLGNALATLDLYGIEAVYVEALALEARGLSLADLLLPVRIVQQDEIAGLLRQSDCVITL